MPRKNSERQSRARVKYRTGKREKRTTAGENRDSVSYDEEEETGNDTILNYTSEEEYDESESEDSYAYRRRVPQKRSKRLCCSCSKAQMRYWHECIRDLAIILILVLLICATLKDSQLKAMVIFYEQAYNFTHSVSDHVQQRYHAKGKSP